MYYIDENHRILYDEKERESYVVNQKEGKIMNLPWNLFSFLYYSSVHNIELNELRMENRDQYEQMIQKMYQSNILTHNNRKLSRRIDQCSEPINYHLLKTIQIEVTNACNFRCKHCYLGSNKPHTLSLDVIQHIVDDAKKLGVSSIAITGGEALLRNDIQEILEYIYNQGMHTELYTNAYLLDEKFCDFLKSINMGTVHLSLDGHTEEIHDTFRNKSGSFKRVMFAIGYLKAREIPIVVTCVLSKYTKDQVDDIVKFFENHNLKYKLDFLVDEGNAKQENNIGLSISEYAECVSNMLASKLHNFKYGSHIQSRFCGSGKDFVYITSEGIVKICPSIADEFSYGDIREKSLYDMWRELHKKYDSICCNKIESCEFSEVCCGGCRSRALSIHHDIDAPDTVMCEVLKNLGGKRNERNVFRAIHSGNGS